MIRAPSQTRQIEDCDEAALGVAAEAALAAVEAVVVALEVKSRMEAEEEAHAAALKAVGATHAAAP